MADKDKPDPKPAPKGDPKHDPDVTRSLPHGERAPDVPPLTEDDFKTVQEQEGMGPEPPTEVSPGPVETIAEQGIGAKDPYPTGNPPPPREAAEGGPPRDPFAPVRK